MSLVGKILVFLNLIFSVATSALIVMVFTTRTSWKNEHEKLSNLYKALEAAYKAEKTLHDNDLKGKDEVVASLIRERDQLKNLIASKDAAVKEAQDKFASLTSTNQKETSTHEALAKQIDSLKKERESLVQDLNKREALIVQKTNEANEFKKLSVQNDINFKSAQTRTEDLLKNYEELAKKFADLQKQTGLASSGGATGGPSDSILNISAPVAPKDVRGSIDYVNNESKLAQINIGSDQGLKIGNELQVYRMNPAKPQDSQYLGILVLTRVENKASVGQFKAVTKEKKLSQGDQVAASITGN